MHVVQVVHGVVIHGIGEGRTIGYPTANIAYTETLVCGVGVYAARARIGDASGEYVRVYEGALVIGGDFQDVPLPKLEIFLFADENLALYDKKISVEILKFVSPLLRVSDTKELIRKIETDIVAIRNFFKVCLPES